jgi:hypothetical protein
MLVLYETALGYCLFKVSDTAKIESADLWKEFESEERANKLYVSYKCSSLDYYYRGFGIDKLSFSNVYATRIVSS